MPNFNGAKYIEYAIDSFLAQNYSYKELIVVDAKSSDASHQIIEKYSSTYKNIIWVKEKDKGISDAINKGINASNGDIIGYLGSDDRLYKEILGEISYANSWCEFDAIYFNSYSYFVNQRRCVLNRTPDIEINKKNLLSYGTIVGLQNIFFKRKIFNKYLFDVNNKYSMDYEFYLRIADENYLYLHMDIIASINFMDGNISLDKKQFIEACEVAKIYSPGYKGSIKYQATSGFSVEGIKGILNQLLMIARKIKRQ